VIPMIVLMGVPVLGFDFTMNLHDILHDEKKTRRTVSYRRVLRVPVCFVVAHLSEV
jgi:hypothetical protein